MSPSFGPTPAPPIRPDFALWGSFKLFRMSSLSSSEISATVSSNLPSVAVPTPPEFASDDIIEVGLMFVVVRPVEQYRGKVATVLAGHT
eukprot:CAMPEP_0176432364 /NCGR_PEP_ID=MMETSP0127-20121128/15353_1 /TAXON_ID=938130 /ORGANISM="Platyophrya macrostoma, Strain WH" /LENGTH=88 /DNA_ID=CAMNT_0017814527 /DNA_START=346 /DNA_END=612 /DNA_ORIENTATION=+